VIQLVCEKCGEFFQRSVSEVNRARRLGRRWFCSRSCAGHGNVTSLPAPKRGKVPPQLADKCDNRRDEFSPFRHHLRSIRKRHKEVNITLEDLRQQWLAQDGRCPYTGWQLDNYSTSTEQQRNSKVHPRRASVDRRDNSLGYVKGNIQFVALIAQLAKNIFSEDEVLDFCRSVTQRSANLG
jgi:hypothetical protein